jgi:hypothetical protein
MVEGKRGEGEGEERGVRGRRERKEGNFKGEGERDAKEMKCCIMHATYNYV